ncbi:RusA family crossover junction endodeoxyribonuclease [Myroides odoratimimus]|uniref:RusA family crossover junction endodeoxyribonuclease n=1 Tax=Myroides odoratimimus TaxID=76832 RepID=UPI0004692183|nr:RusA family crossover junction endodeoxyribonuclease [Myroides odoratimimus]
MNNCKIDCKPLSVNECWQGRRYKTEKYKVYEQVVFWQLPNKLEVKPPFRIDIDFGFSAKTADIDNPVKPFLDILQKKYGINDKDIYELHLRKRIVPKGQEYISFNVLSL